MINLISCPALHLDDLSAASRVRAVSPWEAWAGQANGATGSRRRDSYIMQTFTLMGGT